MEEDKILALEKIKLIKRRGKGRFKEIQTIFFNNFMMICINLAFWWLLFLTI